MKHYTTLDTLAFVLIIVGAINWGLIGAFSYNIIDAAFGAGSALSHIIYILVGIASLYSIYALFYEHTYTVHHSHDISTR